MALTNKHLRIYRELQIKHPHMHVGGSVGLYLHGINLARFHDAESPDIDIFHYEFLNLESKKIKYSRRKSHEDFDAAYTCDGIGIDAMWVRQAYCQIEFNGFVYNVTPLLLILRGKLNYALQGVEKHYNDIHEICNVLKYPTITPPIATLKEDDLPF